jgi:hypothetical protein
LEKFNSAPVALLRIRNISSLIFICVLFVRKMVTSSA